MNELAIIEKLRKLAGHGPRIALGIGDDCAIYRPRRGDDLLFKIDPMIEDIHFRRDQPAAIIGQRALARNLSDIAAMGGEPKLCLVSLALPHELGEKWIWGFYGGLMPLARRTGTALAGGHLAHAEKIYCDVVVCGGVPRGKALLRSGAARAKSFACPAAWANLGTGGLYRALASAKPYEDALPRVST